MNGNLVLLGLFCGIPMECHPYFLSLFFLKFFGISIHYTHTQRPDGTTTKKIEKERILICQNDEIKLNFLSVCTEQKKMNKRMSFKLTYTWIMMMKIQTNGVNKSFFLVSKISIFHR